MECKAPAMNDHSASFEAHATPSEHRCVLVADPDSYHSIMIQETLAGESVSIHVADSLEAFAQHLQNETPDIVILDPALGDGRALDIYAEHCQASRPGLMVFTQDQSTDMRLRCAEVGVDYLMYKPIVKEEIPLIINNLISRIGGETLVDQWQIDGLRWVLRTPQGDKVPLVYREVLILSELSHSPGNGVPREVLISALGFNPQDYDVRRLESMIRRLRTKVAVETKLTLPLNTIHGIGYSFTAPIRLVHHA